MAPLQITASKLPDAKGSASDQPRTQAGRRAGRLGGEQPGQPDMRAEGSAPTTKPPWAASARASWPKPLATSRTRRPGPAPASRSVRSVMRAKRNSLSRVEPVGTTSRMSRSRSTTRIDGQRSASRRAPQRLCMLRLDDGSVGTGGQVPAPLGGPSRGGDPRPSRLVPPRLRRDLRLRAALHRQRPGRAGAPAEPLPKVARAGGAGSARRRARRRADPAPRRSRGPRIRPGCGSAACA